VHHGEVIDPAEKLNEEGLIAKAKKEIARAERVYILGFGFDVNNCDRLELSTGLRSDPVQRSDSPLKRVIFTNFRNINRVNKTAGRVLRGDPNLFARGQLFAEGLHGEQFEMSVRNCYEALADDFDDDDAY
jgi:hypothetical protein